MRITMPVIVSWLFAVWWLVVGIRDFSLIRYYADGSARYRERFPLFVCLLASVDLVLLGYFIATGKRQLTLVTLAVFAVVWVLWTLVARQSWKDSHRSE
jgi:hypothetical protein